MTRQALSNIDRVWLRMEDPIHPMMITVLLVFDARIEFERLQDRVSERLLQYSRFRQRVVEPCEDRGSTAWEDDPSFDLDHHLKQIFLPPPGDEAVLRAVVGRLTSRQLDASKPLWQFHLIAPYGSGCALVVRVHHCLADGPSLLHVLVSLTDTEPDAPPPAILARAAPASLEPARGVAAQIAGLLARQGYSALANPMHLWRLARLGGGTMAVMSKLIGRSPDPGTSLRGKLGVTKRVVWSEPLALGEVQAAGRSMGGTVNDVMLAVVAGALRRYLESHGEPVEGLTIRAGLSVNLRRSGPGLSLGNRAGAVLVDLPVGLDGTLERFQYVKRCMDSIKQSPEASVVWGLLNALGKAPAEIQDVLVETYLSRETAVIANMPGPSKVVYLAGAPLSSLMFWVPALGGAGLCLSIASYAGQVWFGVSADQGLVQDLEALIAGFHAEFESLQCAVQESASGRGRPAEPSASFEAMNALLDDALAKVDALLEGQDTGSSPGSGSL